MVRPQALFNSAVDVNSADNIFDQTLLSQEDSPTSKVTPEVPPEVAPWPIDDAGAIDMRELWQEGPKGKKYKRMLFAYHPSDLPLYGYKLADGGPREWQIATKAEARCPCCEEHDYTCLRTVSLDFGIAYLGACVWCSNNTDIPTMDAWDPLLDKIEQFTEFVDKIAEVHPYAKMAWTILSRVQKTVIAQRDRDNSIKDLVKLIGDTYAFLLLPGQLEKIESQKPLIISLTTQTLECSYFIRDYAKERKFWKKAVKNLVSDVDSKVKQYKDTFNQLRAALQGNAVIHTEITVLRVLDDVGDLSEAVLLLGMPYAAGAECDPKKGCLPGTRKEVIEEICDWANLDSDDAPRIFFLHDVAGSGKSAIAHDVARRFDTLKRLGSSYCFDRAHQADRSPDNIFSTIARDLADLDPQRKASLVKVVGRQTALRNTRIPHRQFQKFILDVAHGLTTVGPTVIVIDALDESGDLESRQGLLSVLGNEAAELPPNFRVLITSRAEQDIHGALLGKTHVLSRSLKDIDPNPADAVACFVKDELGHITALERKWPNDGWCRLLVEKSEGHFQWASTACRFIKGDGKGGRLAVEQLEELLVKNLRGMDNLYLGILKQIFGDGDELTDKVKHRFCLVMGCILTAREPLSMPALQKLCNGDESGTEVQVIADHMGALLRLPAQDSDPISLLHMSFRDFLTDRDRSGPYYIDTSLHHEGLALSSLRVMREELCFNICQLETSHLRNEDVVDLETRTRKNISSQLSYSCRFWTDHVRATAFTPGIGAKVKEFFETKLLYWLEVLSLMKKVSSVSAMLSSIMDWSQDNDITAFVMDTRNFVGAFGSVISQSAPHLYLSALPFAPEQSKVCETYLPRFPRLLRVEIGKATTWLATQTVLVGHTGRVQSLALSHDGKRIVSGSDDTTICVWNADTLELISAPFEGHSNTVGSVAFSHDDKRIVSGSYDMTVRVWNADTGELISGPFEGHTGWVMSVAFSQDDKRIVSGSGDRTTRVWNVETGELILPPFEDFLETATSVAFSPDGKRIVSGSADRMIRVWNANTWELISAPEGHRDWVRSVAFSPDGERIVSGSADMTIRVWNADTGELISGPFEGHSNTVGSVAFSHDGKRIVSGSADTTIRVWNADTGELILAPFKGHTESVTSVAFLHDGKHVVSGSNDKTIRVWNADTVGLISAPYHTDVVTSVVFSPDGKRIVSGSFDKTIRVWNADTGELISAPFEGHTGYIVSVAFSQDGTRIVSGSDDKTIRVWNADTGELISPPFEGHTDTVTSVALSPDGKRIVSGSHDMTMRVWNADTGELISTFEGDYYSWVTSVAFSPDGERFVSGSRLNGICVWNADTGEVIQTSFKHQCAMVASVAFSHDGKRIVSGCVDRTVRVWDADTGELILPPFEDHIDMVMSVAFSPDGKRIVSGCLDTMIRVWNAHTGGLISAPFKGHRRRVHSVAFSPDGERIVSGSADTTIRVWNANTGEAISGPFADQAPTTATGFQPDSQLVNGWMLNSPSELLFWVPLWSRLGLCWPANTAVIAEGSTKLDLSQFEHGTSWTQCRVAA